MPNSTRPSVCLIDAYAMIYRAYFAFLRSPRINSKGLNTSAIFGFVSSFTDLVLKRRPSHVAVAYDMHGPTFRHELFPDYKANRDAQPEDISSAIPFVRRFVEALGIQSVQCQGFEADDIVGTLAARFAAQGADVVMVSPDKDYAQLVRPGVRMLRPHTGAAPELLDEAGVCEHFGIARPEQVIDILGLWGDSSDNIPGCPGVGEKRAKELLAQFDSIEGIYARIDEVKGKLRDKLIDNKEQVLLSRRLATIALDAPLATTLDDIAFAQPDWQALDNLFAELEMRGGLTDRIRTALGLAPQASSAPQASPAQTGPAQLSLFDVPTAAGSAAPNLFSSASQPDAAAALASGPLAGPSSDFASAPVLATAQDTPHVYHSISTAAELDDLCRRLSAAQRFCFDTETTSVDAVSASIVGFSVAIEPGEAWFAHLPAHDEAAARSLLAHVAPAFANPDILKIGQNMKFDIEILARYGIEVRGPQFDTMVAHFLLHPSRRHGMDAMAEELLAYRPIAIEELIGSGARQTTMDTVPPDLLTEYAAEDADVTLRLYEVLAPRIEADAPLAKIFHDMEMPLVQVLADMEMEGVCIDRDALAAYAEHLRGEIKETEARIFHLAGETFNVGSPKQVGEILFDKLKIDPSAKKTKTGAYATNEATLQKLAPENPIVEEILNIRGLQKLLSTYAEALPKLINPRTGRVHTSYNQTVVVTGRLSSSNPNLQNIPVRDDNGKRIRECFVARPGHKIVAADYSQVELRIMAHFCQDEHMLAAFRNDEDVHAATAAKIYGVPLSEVTSDMRRKAKTANFGIIYGISAFGLAERLDIPRREAKELIDGYFQNFPGVKSFMDQAIEQARETGVVKTLFGRLRELPDINSRNAVVRGVAERNAINAPIQGTAADIIKVAMINVHAELQKRGLRARMILQVHDELVLEVPDNELDAVSALLTEQMQQACQLSVPLTAEVGVGDNWLQAH